MQKRHVLVLTKVEHTARRQVVHGIGCYAHQSKSWQPIIPWANLDEWAMPEAIEIDGVIAFPQTHSEIEFLEGLKLPVVCVGPHFPDSPLHRVQWDDELAGRLAVGHLAELGVRHMVFVGAGLDLNYVSRRLEGTLAEAKKLGLDIEALEIEPQHHQPEKCPEMTQRTIKRLEQYPTPFGAIAASDATGLELMNILQTAEFSVPESAAVISIGGDNVLCPFAEPALSSVNLPGEEVGFQAAQLLDRLMTKQKVEAEIFVPPRRVVPRRSSEAIATEDEIVGMALQFIRDHAEESIDVSDVVKQVPLSRRPLELRFKKAVGRTLQKEIWRVRLGHAKHMLVETEMSVAEIAERCGFSEPQRMTEVFGRELNIAPGAYRQSHRMRRSA